MVSVNLRFCLEFSSSGVDTPSSEFSYGTQDVHCTDVEFHRCLSVYHLSPLSQAHTPSLLVTLQLFLSMNGVE